MKRLTSLTIFSTVFLSILLLMPLHIFSKVKGEEGKSNKKITITGKLTRVVAIGGETTGWAVDLDKPLQIRGETLTRIEIHPVVREMDGLQNRRMEVTGTLEKRSGIERGEYWVIKVERIREIKI